MHRVFVTEKPRIAFYRSAVRVYLGQGWLDSADAPNQEVPLSYAANGLGVFGLAALDHDFGAAVVQRWLCESAGCHHAVLRLEQNAFANDAWRCLSRIGLCGDFAAAKCFAAEYLKTPDAVHGEEGTGGPSPMPNDHFWHPTKALACFFAESSQLGAALDELLGMPAPKRWKHSADWWRGITRLARESLGNDNPEPSTLLREVAEINQRMFEQWHKDDFFERWFGELTLAFACAAHAAGWQIPEDDPHPSLPLELLRLPQKRVVVREVATLPRLDHQLRTAIEAAFAVTKKKPTKRKTRKK